MAGGGGSFDGSSILDSNLIKNVAANPDGSGNGVVIISPGVKPATAPVITAVAPSVVERLQATEIGTVAASVAGSSLTLTQTAGLGTVNLQLVRGVEEVIYNSPKSIPASTTDTVSYFVVDSGGLPSSAQSTVTLDAGPILIFVSPPVLEKGQTAEIGSVAPGEPGDTLTLE